MTKTARGLTLSTWVIPAEPHELSWDAGAIDDRELSIGEQAQGTIAGGSGPIIGLCIYISLA